MNISQNRSLLRLDALAAAPVRVTPFPYFTVECAIDEKEVQTVIRDFPKIADGGSFNLADVKIGPQFGRLLGDLDTAEFRRILSEKFSVDVMLIPMLVTLRGYSRRKDGKIHTDSKTKVLADSRTKCNFIGIG